MRLDSSFADAGATLAASQVVPRGGASALLTITATGSGESVTVTVARELEDCAVRDAAYSDGAWTLTFELLRFGPLI